MKKIAKLVLGLGCLCLVSACTEPGETTGIGAATGGVIGAGLGAIVGNQTGNPGTGLVIGAAAGAGTGAAIANALEAQQQTIRSQDEAIERQEQTLRSQKSEIDELKKMNGEETSYRTMPKANRSVKSAATSQRYSASDSEQRSAKTVATSSSYDSKYALQSPKAGFSERDLIASQPSEGSIVESAPVTKGSMKWDSQKGADNSWNTASKSDTAKVDTRGSSECASAEREIQKGNQMTESADKLFHMRRALRMCPNNPDYHNKLGELYLSINRNDDADFEFKEALRVDPSNRTAQASLESMKNDFR